MHSLASQRCFNHALREAAARCPECGRFFCRECITEHEQRVLCATCLKLLGRRGPSSYSRLLAVWRGGQFLLGLFTLWLFFHLFGQGLLSIDSSVHEGTLWKDKWMEGE